MKRTSIVIVIFSDWFGIRKTTDSDGGIERISESFGGETESCRISKARYDSIDITELKR
jgi:hypothetical protein